MQRYIILLYPFIVAMGKYDPIFGNEAIFGLVEFILLLLTLLFFAKPSETIKHVKSFFFLPLILIITFAFASIMYPAYTESIINFKYFFAVVSFIIFISVSQQYKVPFNQICIAFIIGVTLIAILGLVGIIDYQENHAGRWSLGDENSNYTSSRISLAAIFSIFLLTKCKSKIIKSIYIIGLLLQIYFIINSGSRGSFILIIIVTLIFISLNYKLKAIPIFIILAFISSYIFYDYFIESATFDRFIKDEGTIGARSEIWRDVINIAKNNFLFGVGESGYKIEIAKEIGYFIDPHNMYLYIMVCGGIVSLFVMMIFHFKLINLSYRSYKTNKNIIPFCLLVFVILLAAKTGGVLYSKNIWFYFALAYLSTKNGKKDNIIPLVENKQK